MAALVGEGRWDATVGLPAGSGRAVEAVAAVLGGAWRPEVFADAIEKEDVAIYRFRIEEENGLRHAGLPPGFERE